jgi:hypothetical protein
MRREKECEEERRARGAYGDERVVVFVRPEHTTQKDG